jgi:hypothetical protein
MAAAVCEVLERHHLALQLAVAARGLMERSFSFHVAARVFENVCIGTAASGCGGAASAASGSAAV